MGDLDDVKAYLLRAHGLLDGHLAVWMRTAHRYEDALKEIANLPVGDEYEAPKIAAIALKPPS